MENKQTAVEWLVSQVEMISNKKVSKKEAINLYNNAVTQAKAMEKEQIMDAYDAGESDGFHLENSADIYYNETYTND